MQTDLDTIGGEVSKVSLIRQGVNFIVWVLRKVTMNL